jgi:hypothetical protein
MIGDYRIYCDMDAMDIMDCLHDSQEVDFMYECYKYLSTLKQGDFIEKIGVEEVVNLLDNGEIVEHLSDEDLIEELELRGYIITKDGGEDI